MWYQKLWGALAPEGLCSTTCSWWWEQETEPTIHQQNKTTRTVCQQTRLNKVTLYMGRGVLNLGWNCKTTSDGGNKRNTWIHRCAHTETQTVSISYPSHGWVTKLRQGGARIRDVKIRGRRTNLNHTTNLKSQKGLQDHDLTPKNRVSTNRVPKNWASKDRVSQMSTRNPIISNRKLLDIMGSNISRLIPFVSGGRHILRRCGRTVTHAWCGQSKT